MKNLLKFSLIPVLVLVVMGMRCGAVEEDLLDEEEPIEEFNVVDTLVNVKARVIGSYGFILTINPDDFYRESYVIGDNYILVPANWDYDFLPNSIVVVDGIRFNEECGLITLPAVRPGFGCLFEITNIALAETDE